MGLVLDLGLGLGLGLVRPDPKPTHYNRVEWIFIKEMMAKRGFSDSCINHIMRCISSVSFSFLMNGSIYGQLCPSKGLRQGDPLSPYLFLIWAKELSSMLNAAVNRKVISSFKCIKSSPIVSHLFFYR